MSTVYTQNGDGPVVGIQGLLPNGEIGIVFDAARPFTKDELEDADKFNAHVDDLNSRIESSDLVN